MLKIFKLKYIPLSLILQICCILLFTSFVSDVTICKTDDILVKIHEIPISEREKLVDFFDLLIKDFQCAYTLFGDKPCSFASYVNPAQCLSSESLNKLNYYIFEEGWLCWLHCQHLFSSENYRLRKIEPPNSALKMILMINKRALINVINQHLARFQKELNLDLSAEEMFRKIDSDDIFLTKVLADSARLGILLGYGEDNSDIFKKKQTLINQVNACMFPPLKEGLESDSSKKEPLIKAYSNKRMKLKGSEESLQDPEKITSELNDISQKTHFFTLPGSDFFQDEIQSPVFASLSDSQETMKLYDRYDKMREDVSKAYQDKPLIEVTLSQWIKNTN